MCGINFIYDKTSKLPGDIIHKMNEAIRHRGTDSSGTCALKYGNLSFFMGADRLRIVDQDPSSDQPMISRDGKKALIFSGEIYNYQELKNHLIRGGLKFRTNSDTETLLCHLSEFGENGIRDLKGMFAFVYIDTDKGIILAARDRHGMKPLFFAEDHEKLLISSETRGIYSSGTIGKKISATAVNDYLRYRYVRYPSTMFSGIEQLAPGKLLFIDLSKSECSLKSFETSPKEIITPVEQDIVIQTENKIVESLRKHVQASKPTGLMLSGGVDSTLLLSLAIHHDIPLQHTFTIVNNYAERSFGTLDYRYSDWISRKFSVGGHKRIVARKEILHEFPTFIGELDMPVGDPAFILTSLLSKEASINVGVLLSGAGADEYFAGYNRHRAFKYYLEHYPGVLKYKKLLPFVNQLFYTGFSHPMRKRFRLITKFIHDIESEPALTFDNFIASERLQCLPEKLPSWPSPDSQQNISKCLLNALERDQKDYLVNDILLMSDQITMHYGLEVRSPYLDDDLINFAQSLDPMILMKNGNKWILKKILAKYGLLKIAKRPKEGFGMPFGQWIREKEFDYLREELVFSGNKLFDFIDRNLANKMINLHFKSKEDHSSTIFSLMVLTEWLKTV